MNTPLRTIVVEDERLPRLTLLQKLEELRPLVEVVDSCDNYDAALQSILRLKPDLLLLDIQLHGRDSIQLLEELQRVMPLPHIIFTTAYSERSYLMSAIKLSAVDYLLKPIDKNSLAVAIAKAAERLHSSQPTVAVQPTTDKMVFRTATGKVVLDIDDVACIRADGNYSQVITFDGTETTLVSLAAMEQSLSKEVFIRIDRSTIINSKRIYKVNAKRRTCTLRSVGGQSLDVELSRSGIDSLLRVI